MSESKAVIGMQHLSTQGSDTSRLLTRATESSPPWPKMASREDPKEAAPPVAAEKSLSRKPMQRTSSRMGLPGQLLGHYLGHRLLLHMLWNQCNRRQARSCQTYKNKHGSISVLDDAYDSWHIGSCKVI